MPTVIVDNQEVEIPRGAKLNCIQAAKRAGIDIPHYCWHPGLSVVGSCRMCLVEIGSKDSKTGEITMQPKLVPACNHPALDGTVIVTDSEKVRQARARVEEGLLLRHPIDCPICDKAGECRLQDYHFEHGQDQRRADLDPYTSRRRNLGDVDLFVDRCILCSRCVRFTREISGSNELLLSGRGTHEEIEVLPNHPLDNPLSGNVVDLCPVGALADKDFLYRQRVWFLQSHPGVCTGCATGCSIEVEENQDRIYRIRPRENPFVNRWWICNEGRYGYHHVHEERRILQPLRREGIELFVGEWPQLTRELGKNLQAAGRLGAVVSPFLTNEEAYLLCQLIRSIDQKALLVVGPIPRVGETQNFPNGFSIAAEKCPNRRGVEQIVAHFSGKNLPFEAILEPVEKNELRGVWVSGGYRSEWIDLPTAQRFEKLPLLIVQDLFPTGLADLATYLLPAASFAEREGSYVNQHDRLQTVAQAIRPPQGIRTESSLLWELSGRKGLFDPLTVFEEYTRTIPYFSAAQGGVPAVGIDLRLYHLAGQGSARSNIDSPGNIGQV